MQLVRSKLFFFSIVVATILVGTIVLLPRFSSEAQGAGADWQGVVADREFSDEDIYAALSTYNRSGEFDEFVMFASGGHAGQVFVDRSAFNASLTYNRCFHT